MCISSAKRSTFTFSTLLFTFLLFLLSLAQHRRSLRSLLQLAHEGLNIIETVIEDPLKEGERERDQFVMKFGNKLQPGVTEQTQKCDEEAYHFSLRSQERDVRPAVHAVRCRTREERIQFIMFHHVKYIASI